jgi:hypothetical protein
MNAVTLTPYHECTQLVFWLNWMKMTWRSRQTACIHGMELVWLRSFMVRSWCYRVHSWFRVDAIWHAAGVILQSHSCILCTLYSVHCTFGGFLTYWKVSKFLSIFLKIYLMRQSLSVFVALTLELNSLYNCQPSPTAKPTNKTLI